MTTDTDLIMTMMYDRIYKALEASGVEYADQPTSDQLDTIIWEVINDLRNTIELQDRDARRDEILLTLDDYTGNEYGE